MSRKKGGDRANAMMRGYQFGYDKNKTPLDFIQDPETGLRPNQKQKPSGTSTVRLDEGTDGFTIPPVAIWKQGFYLSDWDSKALGAKPYTLMAVDDFDVWVTPGEGTPGNYMWRLYELPKAVSADPEPKHPMSWSSWLKKGGKNDNSRSGSPWHTKPKQQDQYAGIPAGVRVRCTGCGHWFTMTDLTTHVNSCCPATQGGADWAIMCSDDCGCRTLDEVVTPKPGFPKVTPATSNTDKEEEDVNGVGQTIRSTKTV